MTEIFSLLILLIIIIALLKNKKDFTSPLSLFLIVMLIHWVAWPLFDLATQNSPIGALIQLTEYKIHTANSIDIFLIFLYTTISIIVFIIGFLATKPSTKFKAILYPKFIIINNNNSAMPITTIMGIIISYTSFYLLTESRGGLFFYIKNIDAIRNNDFRGVTPYFYAFQFGQFLVTTALVNSWMKKNKIITTAIACLGYIPSLFIGQRVYILSVIILLAVLYNNTIKKIEINLKSLVIISSIALLNIFFISYKKSSGDSILEFFDFDNYYELSMIGLGHLIGRFSAPESLLRIFQSEGFSYVGDFGIHTSFDILISLIPASMRPDYLTLGQKFNILYYPEISGIGSGIASALPYFTGDAFIFGGVLGCLIYPLLLALLFKNVYYYYLKIGTNASHLYAFYLTQLFVITEMGTNGLMHLFIFTIVLHFFKIFHKLIAASNI